MGILAWIVVGLILGGDHLAGHLPFGSTSNNLRGGFLLSSEPGGSPLALFVPSGLGSPRVVGASSTRAERQMRSTITTGMSRPVFF
jgi:hypothetical protein